MATFTDGDRVRIITREPDENDQKSGLYYRHFGGLVGSVQKVYANSEVSVDVDLSSLTREVRKRHEEIRGQMKSKWLDGLSEEGRNRLTEREKNFRLRYCVLVKMEDLEAGPALAGAEEDPDFDEAEEPVPEVRRPTQADLESAEEAYLRERGAGGQA
jgi:ribosomal protein L21E